MKQYIGTKTIKATPAYKGEDGVTYPKESGLPDGIDEASLKDGYMVIYEDDYTSWSPKDVFEKAYKIADTFKERLIIEHVELDEKLNKLNKFNASEKADGIDPIQKALLRVQAGAMYTYLECLKERLARL